jgi:hypothetical protein
MTMLAIDVPFAPLTRDELDQLRCPGCGHDPHGPSNPLYFVGACHPGAPVTVGYWDGVLSLFCAVCESLFLQMHIAELPPIESESDEAPPSLPRSPLRRTRPH